jgi:hypothetical protein
MSQVFARIEEIQKVAPHPNADKLDIVTVGGWQCVTAKLDDGSPRYRAGDRVVFIQPDTVMPEPMAMALGVVQYLNSKVDVHGNRVLVVGQKRLRGEMSFGVLMAEALVAEFVWRSPGDPGPVEVAAFATGHDLKDDLGLVKFEPPTRSTKTHRAGVAHTPAVPEIPGFPKYTDIENWRNYSRLIDPGETAVAVEKLHGTNSRIGIVDGEWQAGSRRLRRLRRQPLDTTYTFTYVNWQGDQATRRVRPGRWWFGETEFHPGNQWLYRAKDADKADAVRDFSAAGVLDWGTLPKNPEFTPDRPTTPKSNPDGCFADREDKTYWMPLSVPGVKDLIEGLVAYYKAASVVLYGEIVGASVQMFDYGFPADRLGYFAFDLKVDGRYLDYTEFADLCGQYKVPTCPLVYSGPFDADHFWTLAKGQSLVPGAGHIREGIVVRPGQDRHDPRLGRVVLKMVSDDYLELTSKKKGLDAFCDA